MMRRPSSRGFTLLETVVAMAILTLALMAIFDLNSGAVVMHSYAKKVSVATLLARGKMTDLEQDLYDKGFPADDEDRSGDFSEEGWSSFKWRAKIIAPKTSGVSTDQLLSAVFGVPAGGADPLSAIMGGGAGGGKGAAAGLPPGATPGLGGLAGAAGGLAQTQMTQFLDQIRSTVREVHLTVTWRDGKQVESVDLVTHVIAGLDRNGTGNTQTQAQAGQPGVNGGVAPGTGTNPGGLPLLPNAQNPFNSNFRPPSLGGRPNLGGR